MRTLGWNIRSRVWSADYPLLGPLVAALLVPFLSPLTEAASESVPFLIVTLLFILVEATGELALDTTSMLVCGTLSYSGRSLNTLLTLASPLQLSITEHNGSEHDSSTQRRLSSNLGSGLKTLAIEFFKQSDKVFCTEYGFRFLSISLRVMVSSIFFQMFST